MADQATDWIEWAGGPRPVDATALVKVQFQTEDRRDGERYSPRPAGYYDREWPRTARHRGARIVRYRVVPA